MKLIIVFILFIAQINIISGEPEPQPEESTTTEESIYDDPAYKCYMTSCPPDSFGKSCCQEFEQGRICVRGHPNEANPEFDRAGWGTCITKEEADQDKERQKLKIVQMFKDAMKALKQKKGKKPK